MRASEIIVVGGGPSGAAFAIELARNGRDICVFERTREAHHKVCGEFLSLETQQLLAYLGLDVAAMGASKINTLRLVSGEHTSSVQLPFKGAGFSRYHLDQALLGAAAAHGAVVCRGAHVTALRLDDEDVVVTADGNTHRAGAVALATGKHNLRGYPRNSGDMVAMKVQLTPSPSIAAQFENHVQLTGYDGGYVGACLVEGGQLTLCWLMKQLLLKQIGPKWNAHAAYLSGASPHVGQLIACSKTTWTPPVSVAGLPLGYLRRQVVSPRIYPLGDQLAVIPSYTGDGMAIALSSGIAAAQSVLHGVGAHIYQSQQLALLQRQFRVARATNLLFATSITRRFGLAMSALLPGMTPWIINQTRIRGYEQLICSQTAGQRIA